MDRRWFSYVATVLVVAAGIAIVSSPPAFAAPAWRIATAPSPPGPPSGAVLGVSCASTTSCFSVGLTENGKGAGMVQRWNGSTWAVQTVPLPAGATGGGLQGVSCPSAGPCFAVGYIDTASGGRTFAVRWNGTAWSVVATPNPPGVTGAQLLGVSCVSGGSCVAVGEFTVAGMSRPLAERWNGSSWSVLTVPLPSGVSKGRLAAVSCASATSCKAVGLYYPASGFKSLVERWNGSDWVPVTHPMPAGSTSNALYGVSCPTTTFCEAVGYNQSASVQKNLVERWNGSSWSIVTVPNRAGVPNGLVAVACVSTTACVAAGAFSSDGTKTLVERWNGSTWKIVTSANPAGGANLLAVACASATVCFAGGQGDVGQLILRGNATTFSVAAPPTTSSQSVLGDVSCPTSTSCFAVGYEFDGSSTKTLVEHWNGSVWSIVPSPNPAHSPFAFLLGISCSGTTFCVAIGATSPTGAGTLPFVERWNGSVWSIVSTPSVAADSSQLLGVSCSNTASCVAVGYARIGSATHGLVERWNGSTWSVSMPPEPAGAVATTLSGVSCRSASACIAVGNYAAGGTKAWVERWNGSSWSVVPNPAPSSSVLQSVACTSTTSCVAVGRYFTGSTKTLVERWTGGAWSVVPSPNVASTTTDELFDVSCVTASSCFAVGDAGNSGANRPLIEHWNGSTWSITASPKISGYQGSLFGVKCTSTASCQAVGRNRAVGSFVLVERYS